MNEENVKSYFKEKIRELAVHICTVIFDTALGGVWLIGEYCLEHYLVPQFHVESTIALVALWVFRLLFAVSTLVPSAFNIYKHVRIVWMRDKAAIKEVQEKLNAHAAAEGMDIKS